MFIEKEEAIYELRTIQFNIEENNGRKLQKTDREDKRTYVYLTNSNHYGHCELFIVEDLGPKHDDDRTKLRQDDVTKT